MKDQKSGKEQSRIKQRQWQAHIHACGKSGLAQNEYCRRNNLSSGQFCYWKKKLKQTKRSAVNFVPVPTCKSGKKSDAPARSSSGLTIFLDNGIKIGLDNRFNARTLADAVLVLRA